VRPQIARIVAVALIAAIVLLALAFALLQN
jgi:hypothetical protein